MDEKFNEEFSALLTKHFGVEEKTWEIHWQREEGGFSMRVEVFNQPEEIEDEVQT